MLRNKYKFNLNVPPPLLANTDEAAQDLLMLCLRKIRDGAPEFGFDTETTGKKVEGVKSKHLDWMSDTVTYWSISFKDKEEFARQFGSEGEYLRYCIPGRYFYEFSPLLENPSAILLTWNGKYDGHVSFNSGIDIWNATVYDAMIMGYLYDENLQGDMSLKSRAWDWCGLSMTKFKDLFGDKDLETGERIKEFSTDLRTLDQAKVSDYASYDAYATLRVYEFLKERLKVQMLAPPHLSDGRSLWDHFLEVEVPMTRTLWCMERRGLAVDVKSLEAVQPSMENEINSLARNINKKSGRMLNVSSPLQLQKLFFGNEENDLNLKPIKLTSTGKPSTDAEVLKELALDGHDIAQMILDYRGLVKFKGTYIDGLVAMSHHFKDSRIHPNFNQYGAKTGRFSTNNPNSQNTPRPDNDRFGIRKAFIPKPGYSLVVSDYAQLEMRITAHFSRDPSMIAAIKEGKDLHCVTVDRMYPTVSYDEVLAAKKAENPTEHQIELKKLRQYCKTIGFGIIYGLGPPGLAADLGIEVDEAADLIHSYLRKAFSGVGNFIDNTHIACAESRKEAPEGVADDDPRYVPFVRTLVGRKRRLPDITHSNYKLKSRAERQSVNAIIQGSAGDIIKSAMLRIHFCPQLEEMGVYLTNQIHDELVLEAPTSVAEEAKELVQHYMENPFGDDVHLRVPLPVDIHCVQRWADAK